MEDESDRSWRTRTQCEKENEHLKEENDHPSGVRRMFGDLAERLNARNRQKRDLDRGVAPVEVSGSLPRGG